MKADGSDFDRLLLDQIADRRSILVLGAICASGGILRFNALRRQVSGVSQKTLTQCVRRLERNGIVERRIIDGAPPGVRVIAVANNDMVNHFHFEKLTCAD